MSGLGLILEGGGMRAGFVAGAVMALMDQGLCDVDESVAVSASVPTLAYLGSGQRQEMEAVWRHELSTPNLVCYRYIPAASLVPSTRRPVLDIDYLVYAVIKKRYPLDITRLLESQVACRFAVTKAPEGVQVLFRPGDHDIYDILKAAMAVPGCYPGAACLGGGEYVDGGTVNPLPVGALLERCVGRILAILSRPLDCENEPPTFLERTLFWRYFHQHDWMLEKLWEAAHAYNEQVSFLENQSELTPPRAFIICPDTMPPARLITRDRRKINRTIDLGYRKVEEMAVDIRRFMKGRGSGDAEGCSGGNRSHGKTIVTSDK